LECNKYIHNHGDLFAAVNVVHLKGWEPWPFVELLKLQLKDESTAEVVLGLLLDKEIAMMATINLRFFLSPIWPQLM
jgi:hypothetical protein